MAQFETGSKAEARKTLAEALRTCNRQSVGDERVWVSHVLRREAEALILPDVPPLRREGAYSGNGDERLALVEVCYANGLHRTATRLMADAFAADPQAADDSTATCREQVALQSEPAARSKALKEEYRDLAARNAALAGSGIGHDAAGLGDAEKARWHQKAREWLAADLKAWGKTPDDTGGVARHMLTLWQADPAFAQVREPNAVKKLTSDEGEEWSAFWNDVRRAVRK